MKAIGDYVGHKSAEATQVYIKIDIEALREVSLGDVEAFL
jgi:site-specific recombinase XerC